MESLLTQDWAQYGLSGLFIAYLIFDKFQDKKEHIAQKSELIALLSESQSARIEEYKQNQTDLVAGIKVLDGAMDFMRANINGGG